MDISLIYLKKLHPYYIRRIREQAVNAVVVFVCFVLMFLLIVISAFAESVPVETIAYEASGECFKAQVWVASVIISRAKERRLSFSEACLQPYQFSCWNKGVRLKPRTERELKVARWAWEEALKNPYNVNMYHDISVKPYWVKSCKLVQKIGRLVFYRERS